MSGVYHVIETQITMECGLEATGPWAIDDLSDQFHLLLSFIYGEYCLQLYKYVHRDTFIPFTLWFFLNPSRDFYLQNSSAILPLPGKLGNTKYLISDLKKWRTLRYGYHCVPF